MSRRYLQRGGFWTLPKLGCFARNGRAVLRGDRKIKPKQQELKWLALLLYYQARTRRKVVSTLP